MRLIPIENRFKRNDEASVWDNKTSENINRIVVEASLRRKERLLTKNPQEKKWSWTLLLALCVFDEQSFRVDSPVAFSLFPRFVHITIKIKKEKMF